MIQKSPQNFLHAAYFWCQSINKNIQIQTKTQFKVRTAEQHPHQNLRIHILCARLENNTYIFCRFITNIGQDWYFFCLNHLSQFFNQLGFLYLIGDFSDDDLPQTSSKILTLPFTPQSERTPACPVGLRNIFRWFNDNATSREIGARHVLQQGVVTSIWRFDQMQTRIN